MKCVGKASVFLLQLYSLYAVSSSHRDMAV